MNREEKKWEKAIRKEHPHTDTYIDVHPDGAEVLVAYDGKTGQRYGTLALEEVQKPSRKRRGHEHRKGRKFDKNSWRKRP
jgi:hypothetical protein